MKLLTMVISDKSYSKFEKRKPVIQNEEIHFQLFQTKGHFFLKEKLWDQGSESQNGRSHH